MVFTMVGPPVPATAALGRELRQGLPPALVEALDRIGDQIGAEILDPLLRASTTEQLAKTFEGVFPKFTDYYLSTILVMLGFLQEDPQRFSALTVRSFQESEYLVRGHGTHWIGQDATLSALQGLATIIRIAKATTGLLDPGRSAALSMDQVPAESWANSIVAYVMACSPVLACLSALANGQTTSARLENVATLAHWSKRYAVRAYHLTKAIGLLKSIPAGRAISPSEEEDLALVEAGLDSYAEALHEEDLP